MTNQRQTGELDPGAYIGHEPELEGETIPGGVQPGDQRVAAYASQPGVPGEPDDNDALGATREEEEGTGPDSSGQRVTGGQYGSTSDANQSGQGQSETPSSNSSSGGD